MSIPHLRRYATLLLLAACPAMAFAQQASSPLTFDLTVFDDGVHEPLLMEVARTFGDALRSKGAVGDGKKPDWNFLVNALPVGEDDPDKVILSVVTLHRLPEEAIRLGTEAEVLYADMPAKQRAVLSPNGKAIRQQLTEEFLRKFGSIQAHDMVVVDRSNIKSGVDEIVSRFYERYAIW